jgi:hypothetical protein
MRPKCPECGAEGNQEQGRIFRCGAVPGYRFEADIVTDDKTKEPVYLINKFGLKYPKYTTKYLAGEH